ncbi:precorrin-6y C5,15-methyltransferase (decarboxylating) subunit CbiE [Sneathiella sp. P13V-1]|uniref:precorrin-6y C5,15-methyltransferase (decarboxylating) subunit CbiE n=1 Tax=Sneathiella sp. P13V-1 TaxID=2697366 RepID=UPI00187B8295|nr:precorrin-6y C5,15-methyltransferase (decarboxylating) subunit CbiE [Sneathiella sp. P13V-1]MBE7638138.1 precorrin-6y C5,15-methyltransferase (decarboxylating) subunit CbiE [Sneathiella sp. P13V-1]
MSDPWLYIIGVGDDGLERLSPKAKSALTSATLIIGGDRHLAMLPENDTRPRLSWPSPLMKLVNDVMDRRGEPTAILATGDPQHFGIGVTFAKRLPAEEISIFPASSAFSLAAAALCWDLTRVHQITLHGRPLDLIRSSLYPGAKLIALSDTGKTPADVATLLSDAGYGQSAMTVLEHMGGETEVIRTKMASEWIGATDIQDLNCIAIECVADDTAKPLPVIPGLPDDVFLHDGQLTKREIRSATLSALAPFPGMHLWDIGGGSGSIAIEWMRCHPLNTAICVETRNDRVQHILQNKVRLGTPLLKVIEGRAPDALKEQAPPDRVFIGGGLTSGVFDYCWEQLKPGGILAANTVTVEGEALAFKLNELYDGELTRLNFARAQKIGGFTSWKPSRQVTQLVLKKK